MLVELYGWTLDYVDGLSYADIAEYIQYQDGMAKVKGSILK